MSDLIVNDEEEALDTTNDKNENVSENTYLEKDLIDLRSDVWNDRYEKIPKKLTNLISNVQWLLHVLMVHYLR